MQNTHEIPFDVDKILSRRELTKLLHMSNDKFSRLLDDGLPVLVKGNNGQADKYSAIEVYRWLLCQEYLRPHRRKQKPDIDDWKDAKYIGDICDGILLGKYPSLNVKTAYKKHSPQLFESGQSEAA